MTGGSPPLRPHAPWDRGGSHRRGSGGSGGSGNGGGPGRGSWNASGRRARSPQGPHSRRHRGYRSGGPHAQGGRGHFQQRFNWQNRGSPNSPHRDSSTWPRAPYRGPHGPAPGGARRPNASPKGKQFSGNSGGGGNAGGSAVGNMRDRRDGPPNNAPRREYSPPRWGGDSARGPPPQISGHLHPLRSRIPVPAAQRPAPGGQPTRAPGTVFYAQRGHNPKDKFSSPHEGAPGPALGNLSHSGHQGGHVQQRGGRQPSQEKLFGRKRHGPARPIRSPQRSPLMQRLGQPESPHMDQLTPSTLPPPLGGEFSSKDCDSRSTGGGFYGAKINGPKGGMRRSVGMRDDLDRRGGRADDMVGKGNTHGPAAKDFPRSYGGKDSFGKDLPNDAAKDSCMRYGTNRPGPMRNMMMRDLAMRNDGLRNDRFRGHGSRASFESGGCFRGGLSRGSAAQDGRSDVFRPFFGRPDGPRKPNRMDGTRDSIAHADARDILPWDAAVREGTLRETSRREMFAREVSVGDGSMNDAGSRPPGRDADIPDASRDSMRDSDVQRDIDIRDENARSVGERDAAPGDSGAMRERSSPNFVQKNNTRDGNSVPNLQSDISLHKSLARLALPNDASARMHPLRDGLGRGRAPRLSRDGFRPDNFLRCGVHGNLAPRAEYNDRGVREESPGTATVSNSAIDSRVRQNSPENARYHAEALRNVAATQASETVGTDSKLHVSANDVTTQNLTTKGEGKEEVAYDAEDCTLKNESVHSNAVASENVEGYPVVDEVSEQPKAECRKSPNRAAGDLLSMSGNPGRGAVSNHHEQRFGQHIVSDGQERSDHLSSSPLRTVSHGNFHSPFDRNQQEAECRTNRASSPDSAKPMQSIIKQGMSPPSSGLATNTMPPLVPLLRSSIVTKMDISSPIIRNMKSEMRPCFLPDTTQGISESVRSPLSSQRAKSPNLLAEISEVDVEIKLIKEKINRVKRDNPEAFVRCGDAENKNHKTAEGMWGISENLSTQVRVALAAREAAVHTENIIEPPFRHMDPSHALFLRIYHENRAKSQLASDELRQLCHNSEKGLGDVESPGFYHPMTIDGGVINAVTEVVKRRRVEDHQRRKMLAKQYVEMKHSWRRRLKTWRIKSSREKREMNRERDRYLLVHTRGAAALMTCKTSSGRTSTKVLPGVTPGGTFNNTTELDSMLNDIENAGGTPGSRHIWEKTLADVPDQDPNHVPFDGSTLITDPIREEHNIRCTNPWTREEKLIFLDKYCVYQKNFRKIASFLQNKATNDCVKFYFSNKLEIGLKQLLRESSSLKRKGLRNEHLLKLAGLPVNKSNLALFGIQVGGSGAAPNGISMGDTEEPVLYGSSSKLVGSPGILSKLKSKKRASPLTGISTKVEDDIENMSDAALFDLNAEQVDAFCRALRMYGTNWKAIALSHHMLQFDEVLLRDYFDRRKDDFGFESYVKKKDDVDAMGKESSGSSSFKRNVERQDSNTERKSNPSKPSLVKSKVKPSLAGISKRNIPPLVIPKHTLQVSGKRSPQLSARDGFSAVESPDRVEEKLSAKPKASWTSEEREKVEQYFRTHGKDFKHIAALMASKTPAQVKGYWKMMRERNSNRGDSSKSRHDKKKSKRHSGGDRLSPSQAQPVTSSRQASGDGKSGRDTNLESRKRDADEADLVDSRHVSAKREKFH